jgi:hypothetical protein
MREVLTDKAYWHGFSVATVEKAFQTCLLAITTQQDRLSSDTQSGQQAGFPPPDVHDLPPPFQPRVRRPGPGRGLVIGTVGAILVLSGALLLIALASGPLLISPPPTVGNLTFSSSGQLDPASSRGLNDIVTLDLHALASPQAGKSYYAWLEGDTAQQEIQPLLLGELTVRAGTAHMTYSDPGHTNLLATFSRLLVTQEAGGAVPITPSLDPADWRYVGSVPNLPTPGDPQHYSLLDHLRHLLAKDPTIESIGLSGGLDIWLYRNTGKVLEWASAARDDWTAGDATAQLRSQVIRVLDYLDGSSYVWHDVPPGTPLLVDAKSGRIGLLEFIQTQIPPGYLAHVNIHLLGLINSPGATPEQKRLAARIASAINAVAASMQRIRQDAIQLVHMTDTQLRQSGALSLLNDMESTANVAYVGQFNPVTSRLTGGIIWIHDNLQELTSIPIFPYPPGEGNAGG